VSSIFKIVPGQKLVLIKNLWVLILTVNFTLGLENVGVTIGLMPFSFII